jgi:hypothetical protein
VGHELVGMGFNVMPLAAQVGQDNVTVGSGVRGDSLDAKGGTGKILVVSNLEPSGHYQQQTFQFHILN